MTSRAALYERVGRALKVSQLLETEIGTALLGLDALVTNSHLNPDPDKYSRLREAIEKRTLGQCLRQMKERLTLHEDLEAILNEALEARNDLAHRFFSRSGLKLQDEKGRDEMLAYLEQIMGKLERGYAFAGNVASALVRKVHSEANRDA